MFVGCEVHKNIVKNKLMGILFSSFYFLHINFRSDMVFVAEGTMKHVALLLVLLVCVIFFVSV